MLVYCDSCILIYYFDHTGDLHLRTSNRLAQLAATGDFIATSDLVRLECRARPIQLGDTLKLNAFDAFFAQTDILKFPISTAIFDRATHLRAQHRFKLADSLHLAVAIEANCDLFLTNDNRLSSCTDIAVEVLP